MTTQATTQKSKARIKRRGVVLLSLALGVALSATVALAGTAREAEATFPGTNARITFDSTRTTGTGVDNPTGDSEIFTIKPDGTGLKQITHNTSPDNAPAFSPDGTKIAYYSVGDPISNPQGDWEVYLVNASDGSGQKNLTNNGAGADDFEPVFSPDGQWIAYQSLGDQASNPEGDWEVYYMHAADGSENTNMTNNDLGVDDRYPVFSPDGQQIAYRSLGKQTSNPEGDREIYRMSAEGSGSVHTNLTNNGANVDDRYPSYSPGGTKIVYESVGKQTSNSQGDSEVYSMNALDGSGKKNLSNNGSGVDDYSAVFSPAGGKIAYTSYGKQTSNSQGDDEIYRMNALDGSGKKNLSNNGSGVHDKFPVFSPDGAKIAYESFGKQTSNSQGDREVYRMNTLDGSGKKNLSNNGLDAYDELPDWGRQAM